MKKVNIMFDIKKLDDAINDFTKDGYQPIIILGEDTYKEMSNLDFIDTSIKMNHNDKKIFESIYKECRIFLDPFLKLGEVELR